MKNVPPRLPRMLGACAVSLVTGCAATDGFVALDERNTHVEPLYRVQQPAGTAAGQYAVGRMEMAAGRVDAAIGRFRNALRLDPRYAAARNGLGVAYGQQGRYEEAVEEFRAALALGPATPQALNNLGYAQLKAGRLHEAWGALGRSLELDPKNPRTRENLRLLARAQRQERQTIGETFDPVIVQAVRSPDVSVVSADAAHAHAQWALAESAPAGPGHSSLVQLAPNVYELRSLNVAADASSVAGTPALAALDRFEISNGVGVHRLARRTAHEFERFGASVTRVSNHASFDRERTEIHFRGGSFDRARLLQRSLPVRAALVRVQRLHPGVDVKLVVGSDMLAPRGASPGIADVGIAEHSIASVEAGAHAGARRRL